MASQQHLHSRVWRGYVGDEWIHFPSALHGPGVFTFADGHTEGHKWMDGKTLSGAPVNMPHNNSCPNSPDIKWVRERTTSSR